MITNRSVVIRKRKNNWKSNRKPIAKESVRLHYAGFANPVVLVLAVTVFAGIFYIFSINQSALKGYSIRQVENEISKIRDENESLKIREAELKSFYHIEAISQDLNMYEVSDFKYIEESEMVAFDEKK